MLFQRHTVLIHHPSKDYRIVYQIFNEDKQFIQNVYHLVVLKSIRVNFISHTSDV